MTDSVRSIPEYVEKLLRQQLEQKNEIIELLEKLHAQKIDILTDVIAQLTSVIISITNK